MARPLTAKQQAFVEAYVETGNGSEAVRRAGYATKHPDKMADELLGIDRVSAKVAALRQALEREVVVTKSHVLRRLVEILDSPGPHLDSEGSVHPGVEPKDRIAAAREINKMLGYLAPTRTEHTGADGGPIEHKGLTQEAADTIRRTVLGLGVEDERPDGEKVH